MTHQHVIAVLSIMLLSSGYVLVRVFGKILDAAERIPQKEWFERVETAINELPSRERLEQHLAWGHDHNAKLQAYELRLVALERNGRDHESRIRVLEMPGHRS